MKQVSNSLLTLYPVRSIVTRFVTGFPRDEVCRTGRILTPFRVHRKEKQPLCTILPGRSCSPRSITHTRLGEGRIRSLLHSIFYWLFTTVVFFSSISVLYGAGSVRIQLNKKTNVSSGKVLLKDIASLKGEDAELINKMSRLHIADAPEFGTICTFSRHQIEKIIRRSLEGTVEIQVSGAPIAQIRLQGRQATAEEIAPVLKAFVAETTQWREREIEILSIENLEKIEIPEGESDLRLSGKSPVFGRGRILVSFDAFHNGKNVTSFWVSAEIQVAASILTAAKRIPYKKTITPDDIASVETIIEDLDAAFVRNADDVTGMATKRSFSPGDPFTLEFLTKPFLVKSGDTVHLRLERNGLVMTSLARAEQDGRLGQIIRVRNLEFSSVLKAKVIGRASVEIP